MLAYCKMNVIEKIYINGYSEYTPKWSKGKFYNYRRATEIITIDGFYYIENEIDLTYLPINGKTFNKYFTKIEDLRDIRISTILDNSI